MSGARSLAAQRSQACATSSSGRSRCLIHRWERGYLAGLLERAGGNIAQAARTAGVDRAHLYRLLRKHGLHR